MTSISSSSLSQIAHPNLPSSKSFSNSSTWDRVSSNAVSAFNFTAELITDTLKGVAIQFLPMPLFGGSDFLNNLYIFFLDPEYNVPKNSVAHDCKATNAKQWAQEVLEKARNHCVNLERDPSFNLDEVYNSDCPREEALLQLGKIKGDGKPLYDPNRTAKVFSLITIKAPITEEFIFRGLIQDLLLKRVVGKIVKKIAPQHASKLDSKIYTAFRILISSYAFSYFHELNRGNLPDEYVDVQRIYTFVMGIIWGLVKERFGLAASIGAHTFNNFAMMLPNIVKKC